jgi:hypothetical protein
MDTQYYYRGKNNFFYNLLFLTSSHLSYLHMNNEYLEKMMKRKTKKKKKKIPA